MAVRLSATSLEFTCLLEPAGTYAKCMQLIFPGLRSCSIVSPGEVLAYLAGMMDGDGYFKVTKEYRTPGTVHPYYRTTIGVQQLWPGEAVRLFAATFGTKVMKPWVLPSRRIIARCEFYGRRAEAAARRLLPYLLVKKNQALLLLEVGRLRQETYKRSRECYDGLEAIRGTVLSLHDGSWLNSGAPLPVSASLRGYERLGPAELGWTQGEIFAYLAGVMDSDGSFRVEKRQVRGMLGPHYRICIRCAQVVPSPAVEFLAQTFGGRLGVKKSRRPNCRDLVTWSLHDRAAVPAIEALLPHLVVKRAEAYLLLDLRRLKAEGKKGMTEWEHPNRWRASVRMRKRCYTTDQVAQFERIHRAVQALHAGGVPDAGFRPGPTQAASRVNDLRD